ncbi:MAG: hypothetical protein WDM70_08585 [Nitrosomonadales bacterium]
MIGQAGKIEKPLAVEAGKLPSYQSGSFLRIGMFNTLLNIIVPTQRYTGNYVPAYFRLARLLIDEII